MVKSIYQMKKYSRLLFSAVFTAIFSFFLIPDTVFGQSTETGIRKLPLQHNPKAAEVTLRDVQDDWNPLLKTVRTVHEPGISEMKDEFLRQKAAANAEAAAMRANSSSGQSSNKVAAGPPPTIGAGFVGNPHNGDPADNAMAISTGGKILSAVNSTINVYDTSGASLSAKSLVSFAQGANISFFTFDPKIVYDPVADRFIAVYLAGSNSSNSRVVVAFSQTNDPAGTYNVYTINGNLNNEGTWTDFPQIGMSTDELFITGNRFSNDGMTSPGAAVWQISKADGYSGASSITTVPYAADGFFSLHPVEGALNLYGPEFYLIRSGTGSGNTVSLFRITNTIANNGILEPPLDFTLNQGYAVAPEAPQMGASALLKTNDVRVQSAYFENNRIEYVHNTAVSGLAGIFHGTIEISPFLLSFSVASAQTFSFPDHYIAFPSIAYAGAQSTNGDNHSVISFNYSGPTHFPGLAGVWYDEDGYSDIGILRVGLKPIFGADRRWGDYTDNQERPGRPGEVWVAGTFGNQNNDQRTWISQVFEPTPVANDESPFADAATELEAYPNPANARILFEFPVTTEGEYTLVIRDLQGKQMHSLVKNWLRKGDAHLAFDTHTLPAGMYIVSVENEDLRLFSKKFVVKH